MCLLKFKCCFIVVLLASGGVSVAEYTKEQMYDGVDVDLEVVRGGNRSTPDRKNSENTVIKGGREVEFIVVSRYVADSNQFVNPSTIDDNTYLSEAEMMSEADKIVTDRIVPVNIESNIRSDKFDQTKTRDTVNPFSGSDVNDSNQALLGATPRSIKKYDSPFTASSVIFGEQAPTGGLTHVRQPTVADFDPFKTMLRWDWKTEVSVGAAMKKLAKVVGYSLIIRDPRVGNVYSMPLPYAHRQARSIDVRTGLEFLGGPALMVVVDHANRTVMHMVRPEYAPTYDLSLLPRCKPNVAFGLMPAGSASDRVLIVGGKECVY